MNIQVQPVEYAEIEAMRDLYRHEANCQIVCDSILRRKLAEPYLLLVNGRRAGYAGIWNKYDPGRIMEFYVVPDLRAKAQAMFRKLVEVSAATQIEAQTNMPLMLLMLYDFARNIAKQAVIFEDAATTHLTCPNGEFRKVMPGDASPDFPDLQDSPDEHILVVNDTIVASGGFLTHYNPPYGDVYMGVAESARQQGYGSYLVQEVKRICYEAGRKPSARCNPTNIASRRTLQKAGFLPCGYILAGEVNPDA